MTKVAIIGGGHNGLTAATLLARRGYQVTVLEARAEPGGMAVAEEFAPGFYAPGPVQFVYQLQRAVVESLGLEDHGLTFVANDLSTVALAYSGDHVIYNSSTLSGAIDAEERAMYRQFAQQMNRFGEVLSKLNNRRPPKLGYGDRHDKMGLGHLALDVRRLGRDDMRQLLRVGVSNVYDVLQEWFSHEGLKGALALDAVLGTHLGPRSGNSMLTYLHRCSGTFGSLSQIAVRENSLSRAFANAAQAAGATLRTNAKVSQIAVKNGRACGVVLADGEKLSADLIVSNADPRTTVMSLVGPRHFDTGFVRRLQHVRMNGNAARLNLALSDRPAIAGLDAAHYGQRLVIAPSADHVERAFNPAKYAQWSEQAVMEISVPTINEPTLAPHGKHVLSATVQYAPYQLKQGWNQASKLAFTHQLVSQLESYMPGISALVEASELLSPKDIEHRYGVHGGHWHHGELTLDQFLFVRPTYGAAQYALPLDGLYLCGAGAHPGGGISGSAGRNCAREIIRQQARATL